MKSIIIPLVFSAVIFTMVESVLANDEGCYYDPNLITRDYVLKNTRFRNIIWDDEKKEAKVRLENKEEVLLEYAACEQFGLTARYYMKRTKEKLDSAFFINKIKWLGEKVLDKSDYNLLLKALNEKSFYEDLNKIGSKGRVFMGIENSDHQSFLISVVDEMNEFYVEISWQD